LSARDHELPDPARIIRMRDDAPGIRSFVLRFLAWEEVKPGQMVKLHVPEHWEIPISVSGVDEGTITLTIARVGVATTALFRLSEGAILGLRGPFGKPWPTQVLWGGRVLVVAGGVGLAPTRLLVRELAGPGLTLLYGARNPSLLLFRDEYEDLADHGIDLRVTVDAGDENWKGNVGVVTTLLSEDLVRAQDHAVVAGPPIMMHFTTKTLLEMGMPPERIFVTLENHMKCGVGLCGHCRIGDRYICADGPVFSLAEAFALQERSAGELW
jgi:NAD(P)H-flavin reductase